MSKTAASTATSPSSRCTNQATSKKHTTWCTTDSNFSEQTGEPILMRMVTRLAHSRSGVERKEQQAAE